MSLHPIGVRRVAAIASALIRATALIGATALTAQAAPPSNAATQGLAAQTHGVYNPEKWAIRVLHTGQVAEAQVNGGGWLPTNGAGVVQQPKRLGWDKKLTWTQQWQLVMLTDTATQGTWNDVLIRNRATGLCLDVKWHSKSPGALLDQQTCDDSGNTPSQQWSRPKVADVTIWGQQLSYWTNRNSGLVMDVSGGSAAAGAQLAQYYKKPPAQAQTSCSHWTSLASDRRRVLARTTAGLSGKRSFAGTAPLPCSTGASRPI